MCTQLQCYHPYVKWVVQTLRSSLLLCRFATPVFWSRSFDSTSDAAEIPHVPHRGAARGAHQWHGGDQHALADHQTLRPLSVSHQWHLIAQCVMIESMCIIVSVCLFHFSFSTCVYILRIKIYTALSLKIESPVSKKCGCYGNMGSK